MKLTKEKRDHLILTAVGTAVVIAGVWMGVISGQKMKIARLSSEITDMEAKIQKAKTWVNNHDALVAEVDELKQKLKSAEDNLISSTDIYASTVQAVNRVRTRHRVEIKDHTRPVEEPVTLLPDFPYRAATFTLQGEAFFHDFGRFLADFENSYQHMRVQKLKVTPGSSSLTPVPEKLTFEMEVVTLINKPSS